MLSQDDLVRRCAYAVATATGVDPFERRNETKGDEALQKARKLWVQLVAIECGLSNVEAARALQRNRETVIINLREMEDWRDPEMHRRADMLNDALDGMGEALRSLLSNALMAEEAFPSPVERARINRRRVALEGAR